jgi:hypothetical protein
MNKKFLWRIVLVLALAAVSLSVLPAAAQERPIQILFMHHSTGGNLIAQGGVREAFTELGYEFWDHGYNEEGLVDPSGTWLGVNWDMPGDNTDPDGWYNIFNQPVTDPASNTFSHMLQADVIIFKSCFPSSNIDSEWMLEEYQRYFLSIRDVIDQHPDKLFIPFTTPPLVPNETSSDNAARARRWAEYLTSDEYLDGHPNIAVFDFFTLLSDENGFLRAEYRGDEWDSHPNEYANQTVGPVFVALVDQAIRDFVPGAAIAGTTTPTEPLTAEGGAAEGDTGAEAGAETGTETDVEPPDAGPGDETGIGDVLIGFEAASEWWIYTDEGVRTFTCEPDPSAHTGTQALRIVFDIAPEGGAGCGVDLTPDPAWAGAVGISFYWRADTPDQAMRVGLGVKDPAQSGSEEGEATPFEVELWTAGDEWSQVVIRWEELFKPDWVGDTGVDTFNPAQVVWIGFGLGHWEVPQVGTIWIDDIQLVQE